MVRTQVQLTEEQAQKLKELAAARRRSMADLVREGVERLLRDEAGTSRRERMHRAASVFGAFRSGAPDLSTRHDAHFADAAARR